MINGQNILNLFEFINTSLPVEIQNIEVIGAHVNIIHTLFNAENEVSQQKSGIQLRGVWGISWLFITSVVLKNSSP